MNFQDWVALRAADPMRGLPAKFKFCPQLAEVVETFNAWVADIQRTEELRERFERPEVHRVEGPKINYGDRNASTPAALCKRFGLRGIPRAWDAIDVTRAAARHGADLQRIVDDMLRGEEANPPESVASRLVETIRRKMAERQQEAAE